MYKYAYAISAALFYVVKNQLDNICNTAYLQTCFYIFFQEKANSKIDFQTEK